MITDSHQAMQVQTRRVTAGRSGYAKAVRRYLLREHAADMRVEKQRFPVSWKPRKSP